MIINFKAVPLAEMRYPSAGDYWYDDSGVFQVRSVRCSRKEHEWCIFIHELTEYAGCMFAGVSLKDIDAFDVAYEHSRPGGHAPCGCSIQDEPGFDKHAPYYWQHRMADIAERLFAFAVGVDWMAYEREVQAL